MLYQTQRSFLYIPADEKLGAGGGAALPIAQLAPALEQSKNALNDRLSAFLRPENSPIERLNSGLEFSISLLSYSNVINQSAQISEDRSPELSFAIANLLGLHLFEKSRLSANGTSANILSAAQQRFLNAYLGSHQDVSVPSWYQVAAPYIVMINGGERLPEMPHAYLQASPARAKEAAALLLRIDDTASEISRLNGSAVREDRKIERLQTELQDLLSTADAAIASSKDIFPENIAEVRQLASIGVELSAKNLNAILEYYLAASQTLAGKLLGLDTNITVPNSLLNMGIEERHCVEGHALLSASAVDELQLTALLTNFINLREALLKVAQVWHNRHHQSKDSEYISSVKNISNTLNMWIVVENERIQSQLLDKLLQHPNPQIKNITAILIAQNSYTFGDRGQFQSVSNLKNPNYHHLLISLTDVLLKSGKNDFGAEIEQLLRTAGMVDFVECIRSVRNCLQEGKLPTLAVEIERQIEARLADADKSNNQQKTTALFFCLYNLLQQKEWRAAIRGKISAKTDSLQKLSATLIDPKSNDDRKRFLKSVESKIRSGLVRRLDDHYGYTELKSQLKTLLDRYQLYLTNPEAWMDMPELQVLENGLVFFGGTGSGKSSFVECLANEYDKDITKANRGLMESQSDKAVTAGSKDSPKESTKSFCDYIEKQVEAADQNRRKANKLFAFVLIDEIDSDVPKKNGDNSLPGGAKDTNAMLATIEKLRKNYPNIIIATTTNHIERCEEAAVRDGRLGKVFEVPSPSDENTVAIIKGRMSDLGLVQAVVSLNQAISLEGAERTELLAQVNKIRPSGTEELSEESSLLDLLKTACTNLIAQTIITAINQIEVERRLSKAEDDSTVAVNILKRVLEARKNVRIFNEK